MTKSDLLRKMAAYIREHGFCPDVYSLYKGPLAPTCGCFAHAANKFQRTYVHELFPFLSDVIGADSLEAKPLIAAGWSAAPEVTADAAAACEIAADLCEGE